MTKEPLTEAEFVNVTRREAFQRFGHEGAARVLAALVGTTEDIGTRLRALIKVAYDKGYALHASGIGPKERAWELDEPEFTDALDAVLAAAREQPEPPAQ